MKVKLEEICIPNGIQTGPFGAQLHQSDYSEEGTPVCMPVNLIGGGISEVNIARVSEEHVNRLSRYQLKCGDLLYARRGDIGRGSLVTSNEEGWLCGTGCLKATPDPSIIDSRYLFYLISMPEPVGWLINHAKGTTMLNLNTSILSSLPLNIEPNITKQKRIASVLYAYDKLIENNRKQIKLLEEAAQRLYKEWFIDFKFPGQDILPATSELPEGWKVMPASELFEISIGKTPSRKKAEYFCKKGVPWASVRDLGEASVFIGKTNESLTEEAISNCKVKIVPAGTILLSFKLTVGRVAIASSPISTNEAIAHFRVNDDLCREYLYEFLSNFQYSKLGSTSSISTAINSSIVKSMPIIVPSNHVLKKFHEIVKPMFSEIENLNERILKLIEARDRMLPKLMSGEVEV